MATDLYMYLSGIVPAFQAWGQVFDAQHYSDTVESDPKRTAMVPCTTKNKGRERKDKYLYHHITTFIPTS